MIIFSARRQHLYGELTTRGERQLLNDYYIPRMARRQSRRKVSQEVLKIGCETPPRRLRSFASQRNGCDVCARLSFNGYGRSSRSGNATVTSVVPRKAKQGKRTVTTTQTTPRQEQTLSTGLRQPSFEEGAGKRCSECEAGAGYLLDFNVLCLCVCVGGGGGGRCARACVQYNNTLLFLKN